MEFKFSKTGEEIEKILNDAENNNHAHTNKSALDKVTEEKITEWNKRFDGNYNSLFNRPAIPKKTSDLENDSDFTTKDFVIQKINELTLSSGGITVEERELLNQITSKFDDVEVVNEGANTLLKFFANGELLKEVRFSTAQITKGSISSSYVSGTVVGTKDMVTIPYIFSTDNLGDATLFVNVTCGQKSKDLEYTITKIGAGTVNIGVLDKGVNNITMYAVDAMSQSTNIISFEIICGAMEISSTFDDNQDFAPYSTITIPVNVDALSETGLKLIVNYDGEQIEQSATQGFNQWKFPDSAKTVGVHSVTIVATDNRFTSNTLRFNIVIANDSSILLSTVMEDSIFEEGVNFELIYRVSIDGISIFKAKYYLDDEFDTEQQISSGQNKYVADYSKFSKGNHKVKVVVSTLDDTISSELTFNVNIIESSFKRIEFPNSGLEALFLMNKKTNNDANKDVLESEVINYKGQRYKLTLHDYNYNTNGWINGRLVSNGTAWADIDAKPFENNVTQGFTLYISFKASNMGDDDNKILQCIGDEIPNGIFIDSTRAVLKTESNTLDNRYTNDTDTSVTFVVHRTSTYLDQWLIDDLGNLIPNPEPVRKPNPMVQMYIDGIMTEIAMLSDSGTGQNKIYESIENEENIIINTDKLKSAFGVSEIKTIAIYNRPLDHEEVLQCIIADKDDLGEQKEKYDKNYVTINQDIPSLYFTDTAIGSWAQTTKDNKQYLDVVYSSPDSTKFGPSFECVAQTSWQGTSSLAYPVKNIKVKLYDYQKDDDGNNINITDKKTFIKKKIDLFGARDGDGYPEQVYTIKVDYMDSSHCRNTGTARMTNDFLFAGNENPAKQIDPKTRDAINGVPVQIYINGEWIGLGNLNHDKSCFKSLGMTTIPNTVRWEIKANTDTSEGAFYKRWTDIYSCYENIQKDFEIVYDEDAFEENSGTYDITKYYDELGFEHDGAVTGGYRDYAILSLARYINFVSETTNENEFRERAAAYFNIDRACRYYLNVMLMGMIDNFAKNCIINMYGDDIWWFSFYDLDSQLGLDNTGYQKFLEDIEPSDDGVYNCSTSKMWVKLNQFFQPELFNNFKTMRDTVYTYDNICHYLIDLQINQFPEIAYNRDMYAKYVSQGRRYLHMLHGNNKAHILRWLYNRFLYVDSLFLQQNSPYTKQSITIRSCKPLSGPAIENLPSGVQYRPKFTIETYTPQYVTICWRKNTYVTKRVGRGESVVFEYDMTNSQDNELIVYCAGNLKRIGDCSDKNPTSIDIGSAIKLIEFKCEGSDVLVKADLSKNTYLKTVSFKDCTNLGNTTGGANILDVSKCTNLRKIDVRNTMITSVLTNVDGGNIEEIYYSKVVQNIVLGNQTNLWLVGVPEEASKLLTVQITNCPKIRYLKYPYVENEAITFEALKYTQNFTIDNSLDMDNMVFTGFGKLKALTLRNMLSLKACGFNNMMGVDETPTLKTISIASCPNIKTLEMKLTSEEYKIAFDDAVLDLRYATSITKIDSNTSLIGLKAIYLPNSIEDLILSNEFHNEVPSDLKNIWSTQAIEECTADGYEGLDAKNLNIKNLDLGSAKLIKNLRNLNLSLDKVFVINQTRDGIVYPFLKYVGTIDLSNYTGSLVGIFKGWDLSEVNFICSKNLTQTDTTNMFENAIIGECDILPIINRLTNLTNMTRMFANSDIDNIFKVSSIIKSNSNTTEMFANCLNLTNIDNATIPSGVNASSMFKGCINIVSALNVIINANSCYYMFDGCRQLTDITGLSITAAATIEGMFNGTGLTSISITIPDTCKNINNFIANTEVTDISGTVIGSGVTEYDNWLTSKVITANDLVAKTNSYLFKGNKTIKYLKNFSRPNATNWSNYFEGCSSLTNDISFPANTVNVSYCYKDCTNLTHIHSNWDNTYSKGITSTNCYYGCTSIAFIDDVQVIAYEGDNGLDYLPLDWGGFGFDNDYTSVYKVENIIGGTEYKFNKRTDVYGTFTISWGDGITEKDATAHTYENGGSYYIKMKSLIPPFHCGIGSLITEVKKVSKYRTTSGSTSDKPRYMSIASFGNLFQQGTNIRTIDLTNVLSVEFTSFANMFNGCGSLTEIIGISELNTLNVINMASMFSSCSSLTTLDIGDWNVSNVTRMEGMFFNTSISSLDIGRWNVSKVQYMSTMFSRSKISNIDFIKSWNLSSVITVEEMFINCSNLTTVTLPDSLKNSASLTSMAGIFKNCVNLKEVHNFDWGVKFNMYGNVSSYPSSVFTGSTALTTIEDINMDYTSILGTQHGGNPVINDYWALIAWNIFANLNNLQNINFTGTVTLYETQKNLRFFLNCNVSKFTLETWQSFVDTLPVTTGSYTIPVNKGLATIPDTIVSQITNKGYTLTT